MEGIIISNGGGSVDLSQADATTSNVLYGKGFFSSSSDEMQTGTMQNNGSVSASFTPSTSAQTYTIPPGYHDGTGTVTVNAVSTQSKSATPSSGSQTISPDSGKYLSSVVVNPISSRSNSYVTAVSSDYNFSSATRTLTLSPGGYVYWLFVEAGDLSMRGEPNVTVTRDGTSVSAVSSAYIGDKWHKIYVYRVMASVSSFTISITNTANSTTTTRTFGIACAVK